MDRKTVNQIIIQTLKPLGVTRIALFGSYARGESNKVSDIDVLVNLLPHHKRKPIGLKWFILDKELEKKLGVAVDLVTYDSLSEPLKGIIEKDLDVIYEETG